MGRKIKSNRKISSDRVGKTRKQKSKILIACEGNNKTEKNYFNNFENGQKSYNITYTRGNDTDPLKLVQMLIRGIEELELDLTAEDKAYVVFDTDMDLNKDIIIKEAIELAKANNIKVITSTPSIELWFLLHYEYTTASMSNDDVKKKLKKHYPKYEKNINIYPIINQNVNKAIGRAKRLEKYQLDNGKKIGTVDANPSTEMYKIVEDLLKK